jgi:hypothetical protein
MSVTGINRIRLAAIFIKNIGIPRFSARRPLKTLVFLESGTKTHYTSGPYLVEIIGD